MINLYHGNFHSYSIHNFLFLLNKRQTTLDQRQLTLNEHLESQAEKNNFLFPPKSVSPPPISPVEQTTVLPIPNKSIRDPANLLVKFHDPSSSSKKSLSLPINGKESTRRISTSKLNNFFQYFLKEQQQQQPIKRMMEVNTNGTNTTNINQQIQPQPVLIPQIKQTNNVEPRKSFTEPDAEYNDYEQDDIRIINEHVHEYYYAIRILPGQNPRSVFIGWITSRFKPIYRQDDTSINKLSTLIRRCAVTQTGTDGSIIESIQRQDAYIFCANDLLDNMPDKENVARRVINGLLIGCLCDISTGLLTFYVNGKESTQKLQVCNSHF